ncbi:MAG TPA: 30S ribosomal protein S6 [Candidatus Saccharimonadales bacterium]|nr:30S ribosomal protein S6 [Candidatus Saccharimonadales bacterium]
MYQYEVAVLYHPDLEIDLEKTSAKVEKIFTAAGGKVIHTDNWGKRKLAYPIKKNDYAVYVFYTVELKPEVTSKIEGALNISSEVIRYLITRVDHKGIAKAEAQKAEKAKRAAERGDADDKGNQETAEE